MIKSYSKNGKKFYEVFVKQMDGDGKQVARRKRGLMSERQAKEAEYQLRRELDDFVTGRKSLWLWQDWFQECIHRMRFHSRHSTVIGYEKVLGKWLPKEWNEQELTSFTKGDIFDLIFQKMPSRSAGEHAQRNVLAMLKRIFQMAIDEGLILKNPTQGISVRVSPPEQKVLTPEEVQKLLSAAKETQHRFYHVWAFALFSGMRSGEMYALTWSDIDLSADLISVTKQWTNKNGITTTKTRENRMVPISEDLKKLILEIRNHQKDPSGFVLPHLKEWTNGEQAQVLKEFCQVLEITEVKFHDLRATFITNMLSQGVPLVTVMSIVGHRKMSTTDVYVRLAGVNIKGATEKLSYALPDASPKNVLKMAFTD